MKLLLVMIHVLFIFSNEMFSQSYILGSINNRVKDINVKVENLSVVLDFMDSSSVDTMLPRSKIFMYIKEVYENKNKKNVIIIIKDDDNGLIVSNYNSNPTLFSFSDKKIIRFSEESVWFKKLKDCLNDNAVVYNFSSCE